MTEGPEALVGGPPLSLSEGPALSAFRLPLGRDATPAFLQDVPCPVTLTLDSPLCAQQRPFCRKNKNKQTNEKTKHVFFKEQ